MKKLPNESMEEWAERVRKFELGYALQQLAKGQDINTVMEAMAARIQQKMLHPVITDIKESAVKPFDVEQHRAEYAKVKTGLIADHIDDTLD